MTDNEINETSRETTEGIAKRPERQHLRETDKYLRLRNTLNIIFMIGAVVGVIMFVKSPLTIFGVSLGGIIIGIAVIVKIFEVGIRMFK